MIEVNETEKFSAWLSELRDDQTRGRIIARLIRLRAGNFGDAKSLSGGLHELRIDHGPGFRIYFLRRGESLVFLLAGGDKRTQARDIRAARRVAATFP